MAISILHYKEINKGPVMGSFSIYINAWKMEIRELTYFKKGDSEWINLPSRKYEVDGETRYNYYVNFEKETRTRFLKSCLEALKEHIGKQPEQVEEPSEEVPF